MAAGFNELLSTMAQADFFTGLLPFLLMYLLFFLALKKVPLLEGDDKFAALISIILAFFFARFISQSPLYQQFIVDYLGFIAITIIGLLGLLIVISFIGLDMLNDNTAANITGLILTLAVLAGFFVTGGASIFLPEQIEGDFANQAITLLEFTIDSGLIWVLLVLAVFWWTLKPEDDNGGGASLSDVPNWFHPRNGNNPE